ncbi:MAG: bifunctional folylpolyglutamate synthase/dihydrofolate synthase [Verrucomicrobiales bacterium]|nr:bifunctional folylpolyglutamate synthase/dihydrofolate synthase [Verrucomicrobiales bacterium]
MTKYEESLEWLYGTQLFGIKLGLENVSKLIAAVGLPEKLAGRKILHVAGTNGKGSVCAFSDQILRDAGVAVGMFTSPHLVSFTERIQVNGENADETFLAEKITQIRDLVADWDPHPTFFEITLAVGLLYFCEKNCEVIILETGMGGRLDATNALQADVSVITQISLDHQQWLGSDIRSITAEKAGILKREVPVIVADVDPEARDVIGRRALELGIPYIEAHPLPDDWTLGLAGAHQRENAALAVEATCRLEDKRLTLDGIRESLAATRWPGRFQKVGDRVILDGAHNAAAAQALAATWRETFGEGERATLIFGAAESKDVAGILGHLGPFLRRAIFVPIKSERRLSADQLEAALQEAGFGDSEVHSNDSIRKALDFAAQFPEKTLVAGSLFLVGETLSLLKESGAFEVSLQ